MRPRLFALALVAGCTTTSSASVQNQEIGAPCAKSSDCGTGSFFCATGGHPNGYCKRDCSTDADCPQSPPRAYKSVCAGAGLMHLGECHRVCTTVANCRGSEGYVCKNPATDASGPYCDAPDVASADGG